jgi:hypothetical protein
MQRKSFDGRILLINTAMSHILSAVTVVPGPVDRDASETCTSSPFLYLPTNSDSLHDIKLVGSV